MPSAHDAGATVHAASTGQLMTGVAWLDVHFEACRPEYEAMLRSVGLRPGWRVLDAGSGSGGYLPLIAEAVGPDGAISALDLAPDNVAIVGRRVAEWGLVTPIEARVGSVLALPYADDAFDAVWFAATSQYLTDDELAMALAEFRRVVRPGGLVAIGLRRHDAAVPSGPHELLHPLLRGGGAWWDDTISGRLAYTRPRGLAAAGRPDRRLDAHDAGGARRPARAVHAAALGRRARVFRGDSAASSAPGRGPCALGATDRSRRA